MRATLFNTFLAVLMALTATACLGSDFTDSVEGSWELRSGTRNGEPLPVIDSHPITMTLEAGEIGGTAACNSYGGQYAISGSEFRIEGGLAATEMACFPADVMESERQFLDALTSIDEVELTNDGLVLRGPDTELSFERLDPVPTSDLIGTVWILDGLAQGDTVTSPMASAAPATLELFDDGTFVGSTGCRDISGSYQVNGAEVQFTDWGAVGECSAELEEQDSRVISGLEGGFRVEIEGDRMTTWVAGDEGLIYRAEP
jgi:heat shock protein HslJ